MFNFALVAKILEILGTSEEKINEQMKSLAELVSHKFNTGFILFLNDKVNDQQLVEFAEFVETSDKADAAAVTKYIDWAKRNLKDVDLTEFIDKFDIEMEALEMKVVNTLKKNLTDAQRKQIIDFIQDQIEVDSKLWAEFEGVFSKNDVNQGQSFNESDNDIDNDIINNNIDAADAIAPNASEIDDKSNYDNNDEDNGDNDDDVKIIF